MGSGQITNSNFITYSGGGNITLFDHRYSIGQFNTVNQISFGVINGIFNIMDSGNVPDLEGLHICGCYGRNPITLAWTTVTSNSTSPYAMHIAYGISVFIDYQQIDSIPLVPGQCIGITFHCPIPGDSPVGEVIADLFLIQNADYAEYFEWFDKNINNENRYV